MCVCVCSEVSLGSGENGLWVHLSKPPENVYVKQIFEVSDKKDSRLKNHYRFWNFI